MSLHMLIKRKSFAIYLSQKKELLQLTDDKLDEM